MDAVNNVLTFQQKDKLLRITEVLRGTEGEKFFTAAQVAALKDPNSLNLSTKAEAFMTSVTDYGLNEIR